MLAALALYGLEDFKIRLGKTSAMEILESEDILKENCSNTNVEGLPCGSDVRICLQCWRPRFDPWVWKIPWRRKWQSIPVFLPAESHRQRSLAGYSPCSYKELNRTEWLHLVVWDKRGEYVFHDESLNVTFEKKIFMFLIIRWMLIFFSWESVQGPSTFCHRLLKLCGSFSCWFLYILCCNSGLRKHRLFKLLSSVQFSSVAQSCLTLCDPMNRSTPGLPDHHQLLESTQTHVHQVGDAIQPSHPLSSPPPPTPNPSQHQGLFQWVNSSHQVAKVLEFQLQHQSFLWIFRCDFL